jgi:hypothetical protein
VPSIDDLLPEYDVHEVHSVALHLAPPEAIELALRTPVAPDALVRALFRTRGLRASRSIGESFARMGFEVLARTEGDVVVGASGTPWRPSGRIRPFSEAAPGSVRMATDFRSDGERLTTETRVAAVDEAARRAFRRYWLVVGPFSAVIRRRWLAAVARGAA